MYYYGYDITYVVLVLPCLILSLWASARVSSTFKKFSKQSSLKGITGAEAARRVLQANNISGVTIQQTSGKLTDHYDPKSNVIRLSEDVYGSTSVAAIGVAAHEAGHAVQYHKNYGPIHLRAAVIPITNIGSKLSIPLIIIGVLLGLASDLSFFFVYFGIACFGLSLVFQLITLPVEYNASHRAMIAIDETGILNKDEQNGAKKTLSAAALTYVAATAVTLAQLLRLIAIFAGRDND